MLPINSPNEARLNKKNKGFLEYFNKRLGRTPNLFVAIMHSDQALSTYYTFHSRKTSLSKREIEAITLTVSQHHGAMYCLSAHTMIAKLNGFSDEDILELRKASASFDGKLEALVKLAAHLVNYRDYIDKSLLNNFFAAGFTKDPPLL